MKFANKTSHSVLAQGSYLYSKQTDRKIITEVLKKEQLNFCAYTEKYLKEADACDIEHFFPQNGYPHKTDDYFNWYLVSKKAHDAKRKKLTAEFLPIAEPKDAKDRIEYDAVTYLPKAKNKEDIEIENLIAFLNLRNNQNIQMERLGHIERLKKLQKTLKNKFEEYLLDCLEELSYISAIEATFQIDLYNQIIAQHQQD